MTATKMDAVKALQELREFIGPSQLAALGELMRGEEKQFFFDKVVELANIVSTMPKTYGQDGKVYLHYFAGGSANWWIMERNIETPDDPGQYQAFGLANLFGGPSDQDAELGYISIVELLEVGAELDLYFEPRTLAQLREG